jgi:hypothetical protein
MVHTESGFFRTMALARGPNFCFPLDIADRDGDGKVDLVVMEMSTASRSSTGTMPPSPGSTA